jgi:hypothetical protein
MLASEAIRQLTKLAEQHKDLRVIDIKEGHPVMLATEAIRQLTELVSLHGDHEVVDAFDKTFADFEFVDDDGDEVIVTELEDRDQADD